MDREKREFLNTVPLTTHQRAYVDACWEEKPGKNSAPSPFERVFYFFTLYLLDLSFLLCLVVRPHPLGVIVSLAAAWFFALVGIIGGLMLIAILHHEVEQLSFQWGGVTPADILFTDRNLLRRMVKPQPVWFVPMVIITSLIGTAALVLSRHDLTAVAYGTASVISLVFSIARAGTLRGYLTARARAYAQNFNLPADPATANPGHPRPVVLT